MLSCGTMEWLSKKIVYEIKSVVPRLSPFTDTAHLRCFPDNIPAVRLSEPLSKQLLQRQLEKRDKLESQLTSGWPLVGGGDTNWAKPLRLEHAHRGSPATICDIGNRKRLVAVISYHTVSSYHWNQSLMAPSWQHLFLNSQSSVSTSYCTNILCIRALLWEALRLRDINTIL